MKKILLALVFLCTINGLSAQEANTSDITLSAGGPLSTNGVISLFDGILNDLLDNAEYTDFEGSPALILTYKYALQKNWFVYGDIGFEGFKYNLEKDSVSIGSYRQKFYTLGVGTEYHYVAEDLFQMYSGISVAYTFYRSKYDLNESSTNLSSFIGDKKKFGFTNFHFNALGIRFGKTVAGVAELGFGYKGFLSLGLSCQF